MTDEIIPVRAQRAAIPHADAIETPSQVGASPDRHSGPPDPIGVSVMSGGRTVYTADIADIVLSELASGRPLSDVCRDPGMPSERTVRLWVLDDREGFAARYRRARKIGGAGSGRVSIYNAELAERILEQLREGHLLIDICAEPGMPAPRTIRDWAMVDREGFAARYDRARELGFHAMAEQMVAIADDGRNDWIVRRREDGTAEVMIDHEHVGRSRLRIKTRQWLLSKMLPCLYGDRPEGVAKPKADEGWAALLKAVDGKSRGLPSEHQRRTEQDSLALSGQKSTESDEE
jgi:hypothetical protein